MQLSPVFNIPYFTDSDGNPLNGGKIFQYEAGSTSVLKTTYSDESGNTANPNPIVLNSAGQLPNNIAIWLQEGQFYNLVLTQSDGTTVLKSFDDVSGVYVPPVDTGGGGGGGGGNTVIDTTVWVEVANVSYLTANSFLVGGNYTSQFIKGNRIRATITGGFTYGTVSNSSFSSPSTTVQIITDGSSLNGSLSKIEYSVLVANNETVDAAGVSYFDAFDYSIYPSSVGKKIDDVESTLTASIANTESKRVRSTIVWTANGSGNNTAYVVNASPAITTYTNNEIWYVKFNSNGNGTITVNINNVAAKEVKSYNSSGSKQTAVVVNNMIGELAYDGTDWILLNPLPEAQTFPPRGTQIFTSSGTFTVPTNVSVIKVTTIGAGGGSGASYTYSIDSEGSTDSKEGGLGGYGAVVTRYVSVSAGNNYSVTIGAGGTGSNPGGTNNATAGGTTSFGGTVVRAFGGSPGTDAGSGFNGTAGAAGSGGTGDLLLTGGAIAWPNYGQPGTIPTPPLSVGWANGNSGTAGLCIVEW